jgi:DNA helicase-2/ATP-dependent DNA helicase PcrA
MFESLQSALAVPFSDEQAAAITAPLEPGVIIAGAGTGKTTVMAARVCYLVLTRQVRPEQVLGLTFTRKAAGELSQRVAAALNALDVATEEMPSVSTYDAFAAALVRRFGLFAGVETRVRMMNGAQRYVIAEQALRCWDGQLEALGTYTESTLIERLLNLDAQLASHLVKPEMVTVHCQRLIAEVAALSKPNADLRKVATAAGQRLELLQLVREYRQLKVEMGLVEFADQMAAAVGLVQSHRSIGEVLRREFPVVLLDEYQDTSAAQVSLLRALFSGPAVSTGLGHPVTAVGDEAQAIYEWRGAAAANMRDFVSSFPRVDGTPATQYELSINRRSGARILAVANAVSGRLVHDPFGAPPLSLVPDPGRGAGVVEARACVDQMGELDTLVDWVLERHQRSDQPLWSDIAVLARKNADVALAYRALTEAGIPAEIVGLGGLLSVPEVADVVAILRLLVDVEYNPAVVQLLSGPRWCIGPADLAALGRRAVTLARRAAADALAGGEDGDGSDRPDGPGEQPLPVLLEAIDDLGRVHVSAEGAERMSRFAAELAQFRAHVHEPVPTLLHRVIDATGVLHELAIRNGQGANGAASATGVTGKNSAAQLQRFMQLVSDFVSGTGQVSLRALLAWLDAEAANAGELEQATPSAADSVKLLSVHKAKGLEWKHVAVIALTQTVFPNDRVSQKWTSDGSVLPAVLRGDASRVPQLGTLSAKDLKTYEAELKDQQAFSEDRLGYVAVSRAKETLLMSASHWRGSWKHPKEPSRLFEAGCEQLKTWGEEAVLISDEQVGVDNPLVVAPVAVTWPQELDSERVALLTASAAAARDGLSAGTGDELNVAELAQVAQWEADTQRLLDEEQARRGAASNVAVPVSLSASALLAADRDADAFRKGLVRPMPRGLSGSAALGTRFHQWVERRFGLSTSGSVVESERDELDADVELSDVELERSELWDAGLGDDEPSGLGMGDDFASITSDASEEALDALCRTFEAGPFASRVPYAIEAPFVMNVSGQQVRGRLDIVYRCDSGPYEFQIIDWKTGTADKLDANQLAIYRLAWAQAVGCDPEAVDAAFYVVPTGQLIRPHDLLTEEGVAALVERLRSASALESRP